MGRKSIAEYMQHFWASRSSLEWVFRAPGPRSVRVRCFPRNGSHDERLCRRGPSIGDPLATRNPLLDNACRVECDATNRKQRIGSMSTRHWRGDLARRAPQRHPARVEPLALSPATSHSPLATFDRLLDTEGRVEHDATRRKQSTAATSTRHCSENPVCGDLISPLRLTASVPSPKIRNRAFAPASHGNARGVTKEQPHGHHPN
jgi:hypothetical protein